MKLKRSWVLVATGAVVVSGVGLTLALTRGSATPDAVAAPPKAAAPPMAVAPPKAVAPPNAVAFDEATAVQTSQDEYSTVYTDANGVHRAEIAAEPQRVLVNGTWQPASSHLEVSASGSITAPLNPMTPSFAPVAQPASLVSLKRGDSVLTMGPAGVAPVAGKIDDKSALGMDSGVVYPGAVAGSDLVFGLNNGMMRDAVVLAKAPQGAAPTYEWSIGGSGLAERTNEFGDSEFVDGAGKVAFTMLAPVMWDSSGSDGVVDSATLPVDFTMAETSPGAWTMTLRPSLEWLSDPSRKYPVYIDPPVSVGVVGIHTYKADSLTHDFGGLVQVGNSNQTNTCCAWRTVMRFSMDQYFGTQALASTTLSGTPKVPQTIGLGGGLYWASAFSFNGVGAYLGPYVLDTSVHETGNGSFVMAANQVNNGDIYSYEMLTGDESNGYYTYKALTLGLSYDYVSAPVATGIGPTSARNGDLTASPIVEGLGTEYTSTGIKMQYTFTTTTPGVSPTTWTSQWVGPGPYRVPAGALAPGAVYTYTYSVMDNYPMSPVVNAVPDPSVWKFTMDRPPAQPTGVTVDGKPFLSNVISTTAQPKVCATVADPDGGTVQALFTLKQGGITIADSIPGGMVSVTGTTTNTSCVAKLPYPLAPDGVYTLEVTASDGSLMTPMSPQATSTIRGPAQGAVREIPGQSDSPTGATS